MTPRLAILQSHVLDALFERPSLAANHVVPTGLRPQQRLDIYRHNLFASLTSALAAVYPTVAALVGEGFFRYAAHAYIRTHPSRSGNLHDFGGELAGFLERFEPAHSLPYLPDCARLDWAWHEAFHATRVDAEAGAPSGLARLAVLSDERRASVRLTMQPAARVVASPFPILAIWQAHQGDLPDGDAPLVDLDAGGESVLLVQHAFDVVLHRLAPAEHAVVSALQRGATLGEAVAAALALDDAADVAAMLARQFAIGLWVALDEPS